MSKPMSITIADLPGQQRVTRRPQHRFNLKWRPYQIQPFMIAPVLPGETLKEGVLQVRAKSDALASACSLIGWWLEHYVFYVKLTDLEGRDDFTAMLLDATHSLSGYDAAANAKTYHAGPGLDWTQLCLDQVVEYYFRDEGDGTVTFDGLPQAAVVGESWLDSAKLDSAAPTNDEQFPGQDPVVPDNYAQFSNQYTQWEHMRALKLTAATFEDWLAAFGVRPETKPAREDFRPELLRYSRDWQYPSTVVDGASGDTTSAVVWSIAERIEKRRFFKEPGFIFGVTVARPKAYFSGMRGAGVSMMNDPYAWLPAVLRDAPFTSLKQFDNSPADGPLAGIPSEPYWVDIRDLFIYGDQFVNFDISATPAGFVALPTSGMQKRYAASTAIDAFFDDAAGGFKYLRQDGVLSLSLLGGQRDTT
jgi:hypothetical protein